MGIKDIEKKLLREIRGKASQEQVNRKLGFSFNKVSRWESGKSRIVWGEFVQLCQIRGLRLDQALHTLAYDGDASNSPEILARLVNQSIVDTAKLLEVSRFTVSSWLNGKSQPRLQHILQLIDIKRATLEEFIYALFSGQNTSILSEAAQKKIEQKELMYRHPVVSLALRCFELEEYVSSSQHLPGFLSEKLGISKEQEFYLIEQMLSCGFIGGSDKGYRVRVQRFDAQGDFQGGLKIRKFYNQLAQDYLDRLESPPADSLFAYRSFSCSRECREKIQNELKRSYSRVLDLIQSDEGGLQDICVMQVQAFSAIE